MACRVPPDKLHRIRDNANFHRQMSEDIRLLAEHRASISLTTVLMCCMDALAAGSGEATYGTFMKFTKKHLAGLCAEIESVCPGHEGARVLYDISRMRQCFGSIAT